MASNPSLFLFAKLLPMKTIFVLLLCLLSASVFSQTNQAYILEHENDIAKNEAGTHNGGGNTIGYSFFSKTDGLKMVFRKRVLHPGSAIGYHLQNEDEIYYIISGTGEMQINGKSFQVKAGDAILTRPSSSHGLKQTGKDDLVIIINYENYQ
jgi:mannose-6-phosphate isomerase-like protein (cupin superfamily)